MAQPMNILVSCNDNYIMPLIVLLESLFENNAEPMDIYFMWSEVSEENCSFIERFVVQHGHKFVPLSVGNTEFDGFPTKDYISRETYFRLLAADLLPTTVDRLLWLDADMVVNGDIWQFYNTDFEGAAVVACPHGEATTDVIRDNCRLVGIAEPAQYFNAGVMLCNLNVWRNMDVHAAIVAIGSAPHKMMFPGQDFTNLVFNGHVKTADWHDYNCMIHSVIPDEVPALKQTAKIIHYVGRAKPWKFFDIPFADTWIEYYERSPLGNRPLKRTSYAKMKALFSKIQKSENDR